jgi:hypothetical protein
VNSPGEVMIGANADAIALRRDWSACQDGNDNETKLAEPIFKCKHSRYVSQASQAAKRGS